MLRGSDAPQFSRTADITSLRERLRTQSGSAVRYADRVHDVSGDYDALYASTEHTDILNGSGNREEELQVQRYEHTKKNHRSKRLKSRSGKASESALPDTLAPPRQDGASGSMPFGEDACRAAAELGTGDALDPWAAEVMNRAGDLNVAMSEEVAILGPYYNGTRNPPQTALYSAQAACARPNGLMGTMNREAVVMGFGPNARFQPGSETPQPCLVGANVDPAAAINILPLDGSAMIGSDDSPAQVYNGSAVSPPSCGSALRSELGGDKGGLFIPTVGGVQAAVAQLQAATQGRTVNDPASAIAAQAYSAGMAAGIKAAQEVGYLAPSRANSHPTASGGIRDSRSGKCDKGGVISGSALVARGAVGSEADRALGSVKQQTAEFNDTVRSMELRLRQSYGFSPPSPQVAFLPSQFPLIASNPGATVMRSYSPGYREPMAVSAIPPTVDLRMPDAANLSYNPSQTNDVLSGAPVLPLQSARSQGTGNGQYESAFGQTNTLFVQQPASIDQNTTGVSQASVMSMRQDVHAQQQQPAQQSQNTNSIQSSSSTVPSGSLDIKAPDAACKYASGTDALRCYGDAWKGFVYGIKNFDSVPVTDSSGDMVASPSFWQRFTTLWGSNDRWAYIVTVIVAFIVLILLIAVISSSVKLAAVSEREKCMMEIVNTYRPIRTRVPA